ncbi:MAG TPA: hypothetical protein PLJ47_02450 [Candidatus Hydrogenedentes bacterium]|nr:hypothetical protein [Candidatus Hydrogenedentota bacterium]
MCYALYLSTSSNEDLSVLNSELLLFSRPTAERDFVYLDLLTNANRWFVGSKSGCSCTFRQFHESDAGFGAPEDWYKEDEDNVAGTLLLYEVIARLINNGDAVDCVNAWDGVCPTLIESKTVSLAEVPANSFRLFENIRFAFAP